MEKVEKCKSEPYPFSWQAHCCPLFQDRSSVQHELVFCDFIIEGIEW